jgi:biotin synthase
MPNLTPDNFSKEYRLYENKPFSGENSTFNLDSLKQNLEISGLKIGFDEWGDSIHYFRKNKFETGTDNLN